jgi:DNA ligase (NAD+)
MQNKSTKFAGKTFVFTGELEDITRNRAQENVVKLGGKFSSSVSKNTSFVVAGKNAGEKLEKAKELGIKILTEDDFLKLMEKQSR